MTRLRHSVKQFSFGIVLGLTAFVLANHLASLLTLVLLPALTFEPLAGLVVLKHLMNGAGAL